MTAQDRVLQRKAHAKCHIAKTTPVTMSCLFESAAEQLQHGAMALPPWVLDRLCAVLAASQGGQFQALLSTNPLTGAFNVAAPHAARAAAPTGGAGRRARLARMGSVE